MKLQTQSHTVHWLTSPLFTSLLFVRPHGDISIYDVLDNTNHIFSESLSSGNDNDWDEDLQKDKYKDKDTQTQQSASKTQCMLYLLKAGSSRI